MEYEPRYIYVISYINENDDEIVEFTVYRDDVVEEIYKKPYKIFFLLEHQKTYGNNSSPYKMVFSKCKFYPEHSSVKFIPEQEWIPKSNLEYISKREFTKCITKIKPSLYFQFFYEHDIFLYILVKKEDFTLDAKCYATGYVAWEKQKIEWIRSK